jgi:hypothetical protein
MRYQVIITEEGGNSSGITVEAESLPRIGERVNIQGLEGAVVKSVTHVISQGMPWLGLTEVRLFPAASVALRPQ